MDARDTGGAHGGLFRSGRMGQVCVLRAGRRGGRGSGEDRHALLQPLDGQRRALVEVEDEAAQAQAEEADVQEEAGPGRGDVQIQPDARRSVCVCVWVCMPPQGV